MQQSGEAYEKTPLPVGVLGIVRQSQVQPRWTPMKYKLNDDRINRKRALQR